MDQTLIVSRFKNILLHSCSYIVGKDYLLLIDPGDSNPLIEFIIKSKIELKAILLTHCHADHIYGLNEIINIFPNIPVYCSLSASKGLYDIKQNLSFTLPEYPISIPIKLFVNVIKEGDYLINGFNIKVLETPGHSDDCLTYIIGEHIFTGDSYIPFCKVFTKWPNSQVELAKKNELKIIEIININNYIVHPGHWQ